MVTVGFYGACESVTGSQHLLTIDGKRILLECGLFQGRRADMERINRHFPFSPKSIDAVVLSHAHIDHSGNTPNLVKQGFSGNIFCTTATAKMLVPMLLDSAKIQVHDIEYLNRKVYRSKLQLEPIYDEIDAQAVFPLIRGIPYHEWFDVVPGVRCVFQDAGHILGSALVTIEIQKGKKTLRLGYTGDLGRKHLPILKDPEALQDIDVLISESTYGDREHSNIQSAYTDLSNIINKTYRRGGKIIIPSFAVERAQELLYIIHQLKDSKSIPELPVYLDSPLAVKIVEIFSEFVDLYDKETQEYFLTRHDNPFMFTGLHLLESTEESKQLNASNEPCIIISASGMCEFGRIRHHLKNSIENPNNTIAIVGYQAVNTLGRKLLDGEKEVNILDKRLKVRAEIAVLHSLSAHADQQDLVECVKHSGNIKKLFLVHGENSAKKALAKKVKTITSAEVIVPECGKEFRLDD